MLTARSLNIRSKQPVVGNLPAVVAGENPVSLCTGTGWGPSELPTPASTIYHLLAEMQQWIKLSPSYQYKH
jgi:hypothetical protein